MTPRNTSAALLAVTLAVAACGSSGESTNDTSSTASSTVIDTAPDGAPGSTSATTAATPDATTPSGDVPSVMASMTIWADITRQVGCNGLVEVDTIIPPGGDPHSFEPSLRDREALGNAVLIVANGLGLEESLEDTIDAVESEGVPVIRVGEFIEALPAADDDEHDHDDEAKDDTDHDHDHDGDGDEAKDDDDADHDDHDHGPDDPHFWFDPTRVAATLPAIADALADAGVDRAALDACVADYTAELTQLNDDVTEIVSVLPIDDRLLVTNHDSLSYLADAYDFEVLGSVIPSPSSLAATNPSDLEELATLIAQTGVPAIFAETQHSSSDTVALAERVGDVEVVTLQTDTLGEPGSDTDSYVTWLVTTSGTIVNALGR